jgi:hypothetical protein
MSIIASTNTRSVTDKTDDEILAIANPLWSHLLHASNTGQYGEFVKYFSDNLVRGLNEIEVGKQFANSELTRNLSESIEFIGTIANAVRKRRVSGLVDWCSDMKMTKSRYLGLPSFK